MLPFFEQQAMWEMISNPSQERVDGGIQSPPWPAMGPNPWIDGIRNQYIPWMTDIAMLRCPSDPGSGLPGAGRSNYAFSMGDNFNGTPFTLPINWNSNGGVNPFAVTEAQKAQQDRYSRGVFVHRQDKKFRDILDGLSNTIAMGEIPTDLGDNDNRTRMNRTLDNVQNGPDACERAGHIDPQRPTFWCDGGNCPAPTGGGGMSDTNSRDNRGMQWMSAYIPMTGFYTNLAPNSELCVDRWLEGGGAITAGSRHQGGAHVLMADGAVKFITDSIEAGNKSHGTVIAGQASPFGLWVLWAREVVKRPRRWRVHEFAIASVNNLRLILSAPFRFPLTHQVCLLCQSSVFSLRRFCVFQP